MGSALQQERAGAEAAGRALERQREEAGFALVERKQFDLAAMSDQDFEAGLERLQLRQARMQRILTTALIEGVHYGTEGVFKKPILKKAGQEELRQLFRLQLVHTEPAVITEREDYVSVVVTVAVMDGAGRLLAPHRGACNSREKRFRSKDGKGWTYQDARETLNDCLAMAEKRAGNRATCETTGATAFLQNEEEMEEGLAGRGVTGPEPWSPEAKQEIYALARKVGIKSQVAFVQFLQEALGREAVYTTDVETLKGALQARGTKGPTPLRQGGLEDSELDLGDAAEPDTA